MNTIKIKQVIKLSLIGSITPLLFSCSNPLTREDAEILIKEKENLPHKEYRNFQFTETQYVNYDVPFHYYPEEKENVTFWGQKSRGEDFEKTQAAKDEAVRNANFSAQKLPLFEALEQEGLITYSIQVYDVKINTGPAGYSYEGWTKVYTDIPCIGTVSHVATATEKGNQYIENGNNIVVATVEFGEVTGIVEREEFKNAEVNYTVRRTNITPFGRILFNINEETINRSVVFTKYDDGWRIQ